MSEAPAPKVSVIMNCLDCERYLPEALDSLKSQSFQDFEIILWDNGSKDDSAFLAQEYGPKLRYFHSDETVPLGQARNLAIGQARGEYVAFLDCDDLWRPAKLEKQVALLDANPELGLVCTDTAIVRGSRQLYRLFSHSAPERGNVFEQLILRQWIAMSSAILRKSALDSILDSETGKWFDESLNLCEEADVFYRIAHDWQCDYVDEPLTVWRVHGQNTTLRKFGRFASETESILAKHRRLFPDYDKLYPEVAETLETRAAFQKAVSFWQDGKGAKARELLRSHRHKSGKYRLFWWTTFLPGAFFDRIANLYFALPAWLRG